MNPYNIDFGQKITTKVGSTDRGFIAHLTFNAVATQSATGILAATALTASTQAITAGITSPAVPRSVKIKGNAAGIVGDVVITGTNIADEVITETIALSGTTEVQGNKAFKTVTQIDLPVETNAGTDTVSVGTANKLGLPYKLSLNTILAAYRDGTLEGTAPTVTVSTTDIESNTVSLNSALNGTNVDAYLIV